MKYHSSLRLLFILSLCLFFTHALIAQETLDLLKRFDKGLPPNGLNGSRVGDAVAFVGDLKD